MIYVDARNASTNNDAPEGDANARIELKAEIGENVYLIDGRAASLRFSKVRFFVTFKTEYMAKLDSTVSKHNFSSATPRTGS